MTLFMNTLYVTTQGARVHKDHETVAVDHEQTRLMSVPFHHLGSLVCTSSAHLSPQLMHACAERGISITFLTDYGRFLARVEGPVSGNVLLRRAQYAQADGGEKALRLARGFIIGKLLNARTALQRCARETTQDEHQARLEPAIRSLSRLAEQVLDVSSLDTLRGLEGEAGAVYFDAFDAGVKRFPEVFNLERRTRRPPLDPLNALLSFLYTLLMHDAASALQAVGLDPAVGFLHADRPGRLSLACDLMEELRPVLADRLALTLVNRQQVQPEGFTVSESGAVRMDDATRKVVLSAWQERKRTELTHPFLDRKVPLGMVLPLQARLLARTLRDELAVYPPFILR